MRDMIAIVAIYSLVGSLVYMIAKIGSTVPL